MPVPSTKRALLTIPMRTGLSQKQDARYLEPGALLSAVNVIKPKTGTLHKKPGTTQLPVAAVPARDDGSVTPISVCDLQTGKRLGRFQGAHVVIGADFWTDAVYPFNESAQKYTLADRVPEVFIGAPIPVMSFGNVVSEVDSAVCNGYQVHVCLAAPSIAGATVTTPIYYCVTDAATDEIVVGQQLVMGAFRQAFAHAAGTQIYAPKVIVCGTTVILTWLVADGGDAGNNPYSILALSLDMTQPWVGWVGTGTVPKLLSHVAQPGAGKIGAYDVCAVVGDASKFAIVCNTYNGAIYTLSIVSYQAAGLTVLTSANVVAQATSYVADGKTDPMQGFAIRADATNSETCIVYTWTHGGTLRVGILIQSFPTLATSVSTDIDLMTIPGPLAPAALSCPFVIGLERLGTYAGLGAGSLAYRVAFSSFNGDWTGKPPPNLAGIFGNGVSSAFCARYTVYNLFGSMTIANGMPNVTYGHMLASRLQAQNGIGYYVGYLPSYEQGSYFLFADDSWTDVASGGANPAPGGAYPATTQNPARLVGNIGPRLASPQYLFGSSRHTLPHISLNTAPQHASPAAFQVTLPISFSTTTASPTVYRLDFRSDQNYQNCEIGQNMAIATGSPSAFDGVRCFEMGFPYYPHINTITDHGSGAALGTGLYSYIATYEWRDARGQLHQSARGLVAQKTTVNAHSLEIVVPCMCFTAREKSWAIVYQGTGPGGGPQGFFPYGSNVLICLYRTTVGGITYYDLDDGSRTQANNTATYAINQQGLATVTILDSVTDAELQTHRQLYGDGSDGSQPGNILDEFCPPAFQGMITHKNRLWGIDGPRVWYTKEFTDGVAPGWSEQMAFSVDDGPGNVLALTSQDDNIVVFKRDRLFVVVGDGPTDNGGQNNLQSPARISSDTGCNDWRSVVTTAEGTYFLSDQGRRLLTRDGQVVPVVTTEDLDRANPTPTSAVVHPTASRIVFTSCPLPTYNAATGVFVYRDYVQDSWTQGQLLTSVDVGTVSPIISAVVAGAGASSPAVYHALLSTGVVERETQTSWLSHNGLFQAIDVQTPWIKAEGIEGLAVFRRLMLTWSGSDPHALTVSVGYDYSSTWYSMGNITWAQMTAMTTPLYQFRFGLPRHRGESVRFRIQDKADGATAPITGEGPTIISMALEVAVYTNNRPFRLPSSQVT